MPRLRFLSSRFAALTLLAGATIQPRSTAAQLPTLPQRGSDTGAVGVSPQSPRASLEAFLRLTENRQYDSAAYYLVVPAPLRERRAELAQRLRQVLDQRVLFDLRTVSPLATGDTLDGDLNADQIGIITGADGAASVRLVRSTSGPPRWQFSSQTVARVDQWYDAIAPGWIRSRVPPALLHDGPLNIYLWQWLGLLIAFPVILLFAWLLGGVLRAVLLRLAARTESDWDDRLVEGLRSPFRLWIAALLVTPVIGLLELNLRTASLINAAARGLVLIALFWGLLRFIKLGQKRLEEQALQHGQVQARTLIPLLGNILRVTLAIVALLVALSQFGYPVGTLLTGLGIGGIAFALAAQKTVENLFGSVSLAGDRAFRVGDWVRAGGTEGAIERIGLRSTSFRTNDRTVVRVPNGRLAEDRIETFGERDRMLLRTDLDVLYETTPDQLQAIRDEIEAFLRAQPKIWPDAVRVHITAFMDSAIRLTVVSWLQTTNFDEYLNLRHAIYLEFIRIIERNGSGFAYPTRMLHVASTSVDAFVKRPAPG